jgi:signal transduction histidine kinase
MGFRMHMSLRTRFMVYVIALLMGLVVLVLFVIEKREVKAIFDEQMGRGIMTAEYIAQLNLENLLFWDEEGIKEDIEKRIDQNLIYVIFYDRQNKPLVANDFVKNFSDIYGSSNLATDVQKGDYFFERKRIPVDDKTGKDMSVLEIEVPIYVEGSPIKWGSIKIGLSMEGVRREELKTRLMLILIGCSGLLIGVAGASLLARRITRPLKKLVEGTVMISKGDFAQKIDIDTQDEIGNLAESFNKMSHQLYLTRERMEAASKRLIQAEKLASIGRISAGIAHEIRNPLTSVKLNIQKVMESKYLDDVDKEHLDISQEGIGHIENFIKELLNFTRVSELHADHFSVEEIIDESIKMIRGTLRLKKVRLEKDVQENLPPLLVDGDKLRQVFLNIMHNACEAVPEAGKIKISLSPAKSSEGGGVKIEISDNGSGIPEKDWETIFEPFYTTKSTGIGLGLANARKIIEQHKGIIQVKKKKGKGACFEVIIPSEGKK